jgi:D-serine dehydratase
LLFDASYKSFPLAAAPVRPADIAAQQWHLLADDLAYPLAVLKRSALSHNLAWMQAYANRRGVALAPHGKTTLSPELLQMQLDAGAWGISFATIFQLGVGVAAGVRRAIVANQVLGAADLAGLRALLQAHADLKVWFLVDSIEQLRLIEQWAANQPLCKPFDVLLEIGVAGKRTGCRTEGQAMALALAVSQSSAVRLCGLECYEGIAANGDRDQDVVAVSELVRRVLAVARRCDAQKLFEDESILLSAGGSAVFDLVLPLLRTTGLSQPVQGVLRSGCYITHDHGHYRRYLQLLEKREGLTDSLKPALEVWTQVQSVPEPGLAFLSCGRRDISFDIELPLPQRIARAGVRRMEDLMDTPADWRIAALNDQHAYLQFDPKGLTPAVGDRVVLGFSHPCTTFDKWRWMVLAEDDGFITGAIHTCF